MAHTQAIQLRNAIIRNVYKNILKPLFFLQNPEKVHDRLTHMGEVLGSSPIAKSIIRSVFDYRHSMLEQTVVEIHFQNPIGLAAGFDYDAKLTHFLSPLGFGFQSIGTITNMPYEGNPPPMLGRLPKSKSLLVNKGFKNRGAQAIAEKLRGRSCIIPLGVSIGRTNSAALETVAQSIDDIAAAFEVFEKVGVGNSYYELNISCPNLLFAAESFADLQHLQPLLERVDRLGLTKPVFIKMPIERSDEHVQDMLEIISQYPSIKGVIFGNLQKDKKDSSLDLKEVAACGKGYFSGKPCEQRSNELIRLAYKGFGKRLIVIGCGGVFSANDAYTKIRLGASLVQLITGMIFEGPQAIAEINEGLVRLLKRDGFTTLRQAIGSDNT